MSLACPSDLDYLLDRCSVRRLTANTPLAFEKELASLEKAIVLLLWWLDVLLNNRGLVELAFLMGIST
jgi:hypothetical protein